MKLDYQLWENYIDVSIKTISKGHLTLLPSRRISPKNLLFLSPLRWFAPISRELKCVDVLGSKVFWRGGERIGGILRASQDWTFNSNCIRHGNSPAIVII